MADIRGDLSVLSIANLVQALVLDRSSGILTVEQGNDRRALRIGPGGIRLVRGSQRSHRLERLLRRLGRFTETASRGAFAHLVQDWVLEELCELFTWSHGTFHFQKALPAELPGESPFAPFVQDMDVTTVALEAARWADDLPRIKSAIRDLRLIPVVGELPVSPETAALDPEALEEVMGLIDGARPVIQILQRSVFPRFVVLKMLYRLLLDEAIELMVPAPAPAAVALAA